METFGARKPYGIAFMDDWDCRKDNTLQPMNISSFKFDTEEEARAVIEAVNAHPTDCRYSRAKLVQFGDDSWDHTIRGASQAYKRKLEKAKLPTWRVAVVHNDDQQWAGDEPRHEYTYVEVKAKDKFAAWTTAKKQLRLTNCCWNSAKTVEVAA